MTRKSKQMLKIEQKLGQPLEHALPRLINEQGLTETARELDVSASTINCWMLKMGIHMQRVAVMPGDQLVVKRGESAAAARRLAEAGGSQPDLEYIPRRRSEVSA